MANRICALCKTPFPMETMTKLGKKDFMCSDRDECYRRFLNVAAHP